MDQLTTAEAAEYLRVPIATMRWWRHEDRGPVSYRLGRHVFYAREDLDRWRDEQRATTARGDRANPSTSSNFVRDSSDSTAYAPAP